MRERKKERKKEREREYELNHGDKTTGPNHRMQDRAGPGVLAGVFGQFLRAGNDVGTSAVEGFSGNLELPEAGVPVVLAERRKTA